MQVLRNGQATASGSPLTPETPCSGGDARQ